MPLNKFHESEVEKDEMAGHATRMRDKTYIYFISVYAQKLGYAQTSGIFIHPVIAENDFSYLYELQILRTQAYVLTYLLICLLTYSIHGAASFLRSFPVVR